MMTESENILLQRFVKTGDATAFSEIVRRHAGLVYGVCLRVLEDRSRAADAVQETFLQFLRDAGSITGSVPGWLHRVATGKAIDLIRSDLSRRQREAKYAANKGWQAGKWEDISRYIDEALEELDDQTRQILIQYFFEGRSMADVASEKGISHPTVSRRIESGVTKLREKLRKRGIVVAAAALGSLLAQNALEAAPASVLREVGKIALVGGEAAAASGVSTCATASGAGAKVAFGSVLAAAKAKIIVAAAVVAVGIGGVVIYKNVTQPAEQHQSGRPVHTSPKQEPTRNTQAVSELEEVTDEADVADESSPPHAESRDGTAERATPDRIVTAVEDADAGEGRNIDLSSPEATVRSFIKMAISGDTESVLACYLPGGVDYDDVKQIMDAEPSDEEYEAKEWLQSFDPEAEMPIIRKEETPYGMKVVWEVTFKKDFTIEGHTFNAGDTMELDATLEQSGENWLIDNF